MHLLKPESTRHAKAWAGVGAVFLALLAGTCLFLLLGSAGRNKACCVLQTWLCEQGLVGAGRLRVPSDYTGTWTWWGAGEARTVHEYRNGVLHGTSTIWDVDGGLETVLLYCDGRLTQRLFCSGLAMRLNDVDPSVDGGPAPSPHARDEATPGQPTDGDSGRDRPAEPARE